MRDSSSASPPVVLAAAGSHVGRVRTTNEDRVYADPERGSFAVIDGVGGQAAGERAAQTALDTIRQRLHLQIGTPAERVREAIALANAQIHQQAQAQPELWGMACVLTLVLLQNGTLTAGHVGDTRLYKLRGGTLRKLTHDHSPIGEREDRGELTESEAMRHPRRNEVYREVGTEPHGPDDEGFIEVIEEPFEPDAALVICSDGLSDSISGVAIAGVIERHAGDPEGVVDRLIARANEAGGKDNVSVVYVEGAAFASATSPSGAPRAANGPARGGTSTADGGASRGPLSGAELMATTDRHPATASAARASATGAASASAATGSVNPGGMTSGGATPGGATKKGTVAPAENAGTAAAGATAARTTARGGTAADSSRGSPHRVLTFVAGLLVGVAIALGVAYAMRDALIPGAALATSTEPRTLVVGTSTGARFRTVGAALAAARPGDTVQVGPGEYREQLLIGDGIRLVAAPARQAVLRAPAGALQPWTAVIVTGEQHGSRVSGLRIAGDAEAPLAIGVHVFGRTALDDLEISGAAIAGIALDGGTMSVTATSVHDNPGPGFVLKGGEARLAHNLVLRNGHGRQPGADIILTDTPAVTFAGNVLAGDPALRVRGLPPDRLASFRETNVVQPLPAASAPPSRGAGAARPSASPAPSTAAPAAGRRPASAGTGTGAGARTPRRTPASPPPSSSFRPSSPRSSSPDR